MKKGKYRGIMTAAITGSLIIAAILVIGTIWSGRTASRDTEKAVRNVSLLYLDEDVQKSLQAGLDAHLTKPIQPEVLFETLEKLL